MNISPEGPFSSEVWRQQAYGVADATEEMRVFSISNILLVGVAEIAMAVRMIAKRTIRDTRAMRVVGMSHFKINRRANAHLA